MEIKTMHRLHGLSAVVLAAAVFAPGPLLAQSNSGDGAILTGAAAYGSYETNQPGVRRLITPNDLPAPFSTPSASNTPEVIARPANAMPQVVDGFKVELVASGYTEPRVIRQAPNGDLFVADSTAKTVHVLRMKDGQATPLQDSVFAGGLNQPYGIAFYPLGPNPQWVYVANTDSVVRFPYQNGDVKASGAAQTIVASIPTGYHWTRDVAFSSDGKTMFVSVGSGSNIAEDVTGLPANGIPAFATSAPLGAMWGAEQNRANVLAFDPNGMNMKVLATGLRNCAGMTIQPATGDLWCVVNERDELGDNLPPDYATHVAAGAFYGWPWYYIGNHEDPRAPLKGQRPDLAEEVTVPDVLFQPHSAPLNIAFYGADAFPADFKGDAFVAMHGSWNRDARTGYKIVRMRFDNGKPTGEYQDFVTGFVQDADHVWGRPVGVAVGHDGSLFFTEDGSGTIWRVSYAGNHPA
jgi:glucose/arabinose dehydrogenase